MIVLTSNQIKALPAEQVSHAYEQAKKHLNSLLAVVEPDNRQKPQLQENIKAARMQFILLGLRQNPRLSAKVQLAA